MRHLSSVEGALWRGLLALVIGGNLVLALGLAGAQSLNLMSWPRAERIDSSGWLRLVQHGEFWRSLSYSIALSLITLVIAVALALAMQRMFAHALGNGLLRRLLLLPLALPGVAAALLAFVVLGDSGVLSRIGHALGWIKAPAEFPSLLFEPGGRGIVLTHLVLVAPVFALLFERLAAHLRLPWLIEQARTLGANPRQAWWRVALPLLLRQARPVILVYALALVGAYEIPLMIGGAQPPMLSVAIAEAVDGYDLATRPYGYAMACAYFVLLITVWAAAMVVIRRSRGKRGD